MHQNHSGFDSAAKAGADSATAAQGDNASAGALAAMQKDVMQSIGHVAGKAGTGVGAGGEAAAAGAAAAGAAVDKGFDIKNEKDPIVARHHEGSEPPLVIPGEQFKPHDMIQPWPKDIPRDIPVSNIPSDKERSDAKETLDGKLTKVGSPEDDKTMHALTSAITSGDSKAFAEACKNADPKRLAALIGEVNKALKDSGSSVSLDMTEDGKVMMSDANKPTALTFDPATGRVSAREVEHNADGSMRVKPGELMHVDTDKAYNEMKDAGVKSVNGIGGILKGHLEFPPGDWEKIPHHPSGPIWPDFGKVDDRKTLDFNPIRPVY